MTAAWAGYRRRDGVLLASVDQPLEPLAALETYYRELGVIDLYRYIAVWEQWTYYTVDVVRFASTTEAEGRLRKVASQELA